MKSETLSITSRIPLNNGTSIPQFGFGVWRIGNGDNEETRKAVLIALEAGYRHIDTAAAYRNEAGVGQAIRESGIPRCEIFVTTKLANIHQREGRQQHGFERSLDLLKLDWIDLYLEHWPVPGRYNESWKLMEGWYRQGLARAIGVSNFRASHLLDLMRDAEITPAANQIEHNPGMQDHETIAFCRERGIVVEASSPLGRGNVAGNPEIEAIGAKYGKTGPQAVLRWMLQRGIVVFPKSSHRERILENAELFDFELSEEDCRNFEAMNANMRTGNDPDDPGTYIYRALD